MFIHHVGSAAGDARSGYNLKPGVPRFDRVEKLRESASVTAGLAVEIILVSDFDILQRERRGMSVLGTPRTPSAARAAGDVLDFLQRLIHVDAHAATKSEACVYAEHWLDVQILAPFQEFEQPHPVG